MPVLRMTTSKGSLLRADWVRSTSDRHIGSPLLGIGSQLPVGKKASGDRLGASDGCLGG